MTGRSRAFNPETIVRVYNAGASTNETARLIGCCPQTVTRALRDARRSGQAVRNDYGHHIKPVVQSVAWLAQRGWTYSEIARAFGMTRCMVAGIVYRAKKREAA